MKFEEEKFSYIKRQESKEKTVGSNFKIKLTLSPEDRSSKPTNAAKENRLLSSLSTVEITPEQFQQLIIAPHSRSWCAAVFNGKRTSKSFVSTQVVALNFDNDEVNLRTKGLAPILPETVENRCKEEGLNVSFIYSSISHTPDQPRFCAVWILENPIDNLLDAKKVAKLLMAIFPEADEASKYPSRIFYGGRVWITGDIRYRLSIKQLESVGIPILASQAKLGQLARTIKRLLIKKRANSVHPLYNIIEGAHFSTVYNKPLEHFDWNYAAEKCTILRKLLDAKEKLYHSDLLFLASGMLYIRGGTTKFKQAIRYNPNIADEKQFIIEHIHAREKEDISDKIYPISFTSLPSHHPDAHLKNHYKNLLAIRPVRQYDKPRLIKDERKLLTIKDAREQLEIEFAKALQSEDETIHVFRCATGIGKTRLALQQREVVILFPNHDLKDEKSREMQLSHLCTPRLPKSLPDLCRKKYEQLCKIGQHKVANKYLLDISKGDVFLNISDEELKQCKEDLEIYFEQQHQCFTTPHTILTTHQKGVFVDFPKHSKYIIDEDILSTLLKEEKISSGDLQLLKTSLQEKGAIIDADKLERFEQQLASQIEDTISFEPIVFENQAIVEEAIVELAEKLSGNVTAFFNCITYVVTPKDSDYPKGELTLSFIKRIELIPGKKYIILSATANEILYHKLFKGNIKFHDLSHVEHQGRIIQISDKSFSRSALKDEKRLEVAKNFLPNLPAITFKKLRPEIPGADGIVHFGKCEGYNHLSGKDIKVIGTPHVNVHTYRLIAKALGISISPGSDQLKQQKVEHNGYEFYFYTFENEDIRAIQFYFIERELIQAIGRARLSDHDAVVFLFSDFPLPGAEQYCLAEMETIQKEYEDYTQVRTEKGIKSGNGEQLNLPLE